MSDTLSFSLAMRNILSPHLKKNIHVENVWESETQTLVQLKTRYAHFKQLLKIIHSTQTYTAKLNYYY